MLRRALLSLAVTLFAGVSASADNGMNILGDYSLTSWGQKDGLNSSVIWSVAQDHDGYIWLGTDNGVVRFDGVRFMPWHLLMAVPPRQVSVRSIWTSRNGDMWFGLGEPGGVVRLSAGQVSTYDATDGLMAGAVTVLFEDGVGTVWAGNRAGMHRFTAERWERVGRGLPEGPLYSAYTDRAGALLVGTPVGIFRRNPGDEDFHPYEPFESQVRSIAEDPEGTFWLADPIIGFRRLHERVTASHGAEKGRGNRLLRDRRGNLWVGTLGQGLWRIRQAADSRTRIVEKTTAVTGFSDDGVTSLFEDREGNIWAATLDGLNRLTPHKVTPVLNVGLVSSVDATSDGTVWVGTVDALIPFPNGDILERREPTLLAGAPLAAMHADERGTLWVATNRNLLRFADGRSAILPLTGSAPHQISSMTSDFDGGIWLYDLTRGLLRWNDGRFLAVDLPPELRKAVVVSSYSDRSGRVWFGLADARVASVDRVGSFTLYGPEHGLTAGPYRAIHQDRHGAIWLGGNQGLSRQTGSRFDTLLADDEFPAESLTAIIDDDSGHLWLATEGSGIIRIHESEVARALATPSYPIRFSRYDKFDGFAGTPRWFGNRSVVRAPDGRLWFVAGRGVTVIDPDEIDEEQVPSLPVRIEGIVADDRREPAVPGLQLPPRTTRVEVEYTVLNLSAPLKTRFKYRLEGFDPDWIDAGTRRQAFYTNLPPRAYQFRVVSSRSDGTWDEPGASWAFTIRPMFYQTTGFLIACAVMVAAVVGAAWRLHLRRIRQQFSLLIGERARLSRELHDTLLQSLFGVAVQCDAMGRELAGSAPHLKEQFARMRHDVEEDIRDARQSIWNLRSPRLQGQGLVAALRDLCEHNTASAAAAFAFGTTGTVRPVRHDVEEQLLRIGREAVSNAVRHAHAATIRMELAYADGSVVLRVRDDGVGFDPAAVQKNGHYGLASMRERAESVSGRLRIESRPGGGTLVEAEAPHE